MTRLKIALVQQETVWHDPPANWKRLQESVRDAAAAGARVVAFTEMFATGFTMAAEKHAESIPGLTTEVVCGAARQSGVYVIATAIEQHAPKPRNAAFAVSPKGEILAVYRKIHPFSFGDENNHYVGGDELPLFEVDGIKAGLQICYDLRFPEPFRLLAGAGAQVVFVPANWPSRRTMHWTTLLAARAIENQMVICGINRVGKDPNVEYPGLSAIHDARGEVLARGDAREALVAAEVDFDDVAAWRAQFPALRDRRTELYARLSRS
jgi:predicted amidohydrolase